MWPTSQIKTRKSGKKVTQVTHFSVKANKKYGGAHGKSLITPDVVIFDS